jgi:HD superfamily phosphohydrolase YqeK
VSTVIEDAAAGRLPDWARLGRRRFAHVERVAALLDDWAAALALPAGERTRWRAAGYLHDALRDEAPEELRRLLPARWRGLDDRLLHGPATAERLRRDGIDDEPLLRAITWHTLGHPELADIGRALFIADFIEPGRRYEPVLLAVLRARMPAARDAVLHDVLHARMQRLLRDGRAISAQTVAFWNTLHDGPSQARDVGPTRD